MTHCAYATIACAALLMVACSADPGLPEADAGGDAGPRVCEVDACQGRAPGTLTVGYGVTDSDTGIVHYRSIEEGDEVPIEPGWQGGQHIWLLLRAEGVETCFVTPRYVIVDGSGDVVLDREFGGEFFQLPDRDGVYEFLAYAAFIADPEQIHRQSVTLHAEVSDGCGNLISDTIEIVPVDSRLDESNASEI